MPAGDIKRHRGWFVVAVVFATIGAWQAFTVVDGLIDGDYFRALAALAGIVVCCWFGGDVWRHAHRRIVPSQSPGS